MPRSAPESLRIRTSPPRASTCRRLDGRSRSLARISSALSTIGSLLFLDRVMDACDRDGPDMVQAVVAEDDRPLYLLAPVFVAVVEKRLYPLVGNDAAGAGQVHVADGSLDFHF